MAETQKHPRKWSKVEEEQLLTRIKSGDVIEDIAKSLSRSVGGCSIRLKKLCLDLVEKDKIPIEEVCRDYKLSPEDLTTQKTIETKKTLKLTNQERIDKAKGLMGEAIKMLEF